MDKKIALVAIALLAVGMLFTMGCIGEQAPQGQITQSQDFFPAGTESAAPQDTVEDGEMPQPPSFPES